MSRGRPKKVVLDEEMIANIPLDESQDEAIESSVIAALGTELVEKGSIEPLPTVDQKAIRFFKLAKIPYCEKCGNQYENTPDGKPFCRLKRSDCPRIVDEVAEL